MFMPFWDPTMILLLPALALAFYAQWKVKSTYDRLSRVPAAAGRTGQQVAGALLDANGVAGVTIREVPGRLTDNFDPRTRTVNLSEDIYDGTSVAALGVAAHEIGHVLQHQRGYLPIALRDSIVPAANLGSSLAFPLFFIGMLFGRGVGTWFMDLGIALFGLAVLFHVVTLPTEFDASRRALRELNDRGILAPAELSQAREVLNAAALTYVAAASVALLHLLRLILIRNSRD
ncbi:MAG TPA: zinc metallopeptidase [Candidatus Saccharimonadales bacterium]|nr:zinc metallopeptidase [Candidatus Saccharimonadales bacterium]